MSIRIGFGYDIHPFVKDRGAHRLLVLGGVVVDGPSLEGHSDADVICHAVADSLLAAAGLPDIGSRFPADDDRYRDVSSVDLLTDVAAAIAAQRWRLGNISVVIAAERPNLAEHNAAMVAAITASISILGEPTEGLPLVTITAKRGEGVGSIGRGEAIAAWATALIERD